jgi:hypothetical protein
MGCIESRNRESHKVHANIDDEGHVCHDSTSASDSSARQKSQWDRCRRRAPGSSTLHGMDPVGKGPSNKSLKNGLAPISEIRTHSFTFTPRSASNYTLSHEARDRLTVENVGSFLGTSDRKILTRHISQRRGNCR